ncbi:hypothetical protein BH23ACT10_BH23ACT10_38550 [soil metagenome]
MDLFGERGYRATRVADIEARAGLSPRAGGFYRHFASKEEAFRAALDRWIAEVAAFPTTPDELLPLDDLRSELLVVARGVLRLLDRQRELFRFLGRDGTEFPALVAHVHDQLVARGYTQTMQFLAARLPNTAPPDYRLRALAANALGALVHYHQDTVMYGHPPADAAEPDFVDAWVDLWCCWFDHHAD